MNTNNRRRWFRVPVLTLAGAALLVLPCHASGESNRRKLWSGVWVSVPKESTVRFSKPDRWQVTPPADIFRPRLNTDATGYFDLIRSNYPLPRNVSAWASDLRRFNKSQGFKKITVRARPKERSVEEIYYDPKQKVRVAAKRLVVSRRAYVQSYFSSLEKDHGNPGVRAMRQSVLSLSRRR